MSEPEKDRRRFEVARRIAPKAVDRHGLLEMCIAAREGDNRLTPSAARDEIGLGDGRDAFEALQAIADLDARFREGRTRCDARDAETARRLGRVDVEAEEVERRACIASAFFGDGCARWARKEVERRRPAERAENGRRRRGARE